MNHLVKICLISLVLIGCSSDTKNTQVNSEPATSIQPQTEEKRVFDYQPRQPINGQLYATIELGALGLNYFIAEIDNENRWVLTESSFGRSNIIYGVNSSNEIFEKILEYRSEILSKGVTASNIHILASSSAIKSKIIEELKVRLNAKGLTVNYIDAEAEGNYALAATIPQEFITESFLVDIGSGNTKLSWVENNDTLSIDIHGSKYFLSDVHDTTVFREVRDALLEIPEKNRNLCFMLGGMIYEFEKDKVENSDTRYFVLKSPSQYPTNNEKLKAANIIYNALYLEPTFSYIFDSQSTFSIGYLLELKK